MTYYINLFKKQICLVIVRPPWSQLTYRCTRSTWPQFTKLKSIELSVNLSLYMVNPLWALPKPRRDLRILVKILIKLRRITLEQIEDSKKVWITLVICPMKKFLSTLWLLDYAFHTRNLVVFGVKKKKKLNLKLSQSTKRRDCQIRSAGKMQKNTPIWILTRGHAARVGLSQLRRRWKLSTLSQKTPIQ